MVQLYSTYWMFQCLWPKMFLYKLKLAVLRCTFRDMGAASFSQIMGGCERHMKIWHSCPKTMSNFEIHVQEIHMVKETDYINSHWLTWLHWNVISIITSNNSSSNNEELKFHWNLKHFSKEECQLHFSLQKRCSHFRVKTAFILSWKLKWWNLDLRDQYVLP